MKVSKIDNINHYKTKYKAILIRGDDKNEDLTEDTIKKIDERLCKSISHKNSKTNIYKYKDILDKINFTEKEINEINEYLKVKEILNRVKEILNQDDIKKITDIKKRLNKVNKILSDENKKNDAIENNVTKDIVLTTINNYLLYNNKNSIYEKEFDELGRDLLKFLAYRKTKQKIRIKKSLTNNKIYTEDTNNKKFILSFTKEENNVIQIDENKIDEIFEKYGFEGCLNKIIKIEYEFKNNKINKNFIINLINEIIYNSKKEELKKLEYSDEQLIELNGLYGELEQFFKNEFSKTKIITQNNLNKIFNQGGKNIIKNIIKNRIKNKLTQHYILKGKLKYYGILEQNVDTYELSIIKSKESVKKQFLTSLVMAGSRLKLIYDKDNKCNDKDIYKIENVDNDIEENLAKLIIGLYDFDYKDLCKEMFKCLILLRNNFVHFKNLTLEEMTEAISNSDTNDIQFKEIFKLLNADKDKAEENMLLNIKNMNIFECDSNIINFNLIEEINLCPNLCSYSYPSFSNVYKKGLDMNKFFENNYTIYKEKENLTDTQYLGYKNYLQLVYKHNFLNNIDNIKLSKSISQILKQNKEANKNKQGYKYNEIDKLWQVYCKNNNNTDIQSFFIDIQRKEMDKASLNEQNEKNKNQYTDFIRDVYAHCFNSWLNDKCKNESNIDKNNILEKINIKGLEQFKIDCTKDEEKIYLIYYSLFKFLDNHQIGQIQAHLKKYYAINNKSSINLEFFEKLNAYAELAKISTPIFNLYIENNKDSQKKKDNIQQLNNYIIDTMKNFFKEDDILQDELYLQEDKKTPIYHKGITDLILSGRQELFKGKYKEFITKDDIEKYRESSKEIENSQKNRTEIHKNIMGYDKDDKKEKTQKKEDKLSTNDKMVKEYEKFVKKIEEYNEIKNKITFVNFSKLSKLQYEILSRYIGYTLDWERDMQFLLLGINNGAVSKDKINNIFDRCVRDNLTEKINEKIGQEFKGFLWRIYSKEEKLISKKNIRFIFNIRNKIAHMDILRENDKSMLSYILDIQNLMSYDRKKRNAITKSIIEIFEKNNMDIAFDITNYGSKNLKLKYVKSKKSQHLKDKIKPEEVKDNGNKNNKKPKIEFDIQNKQYVDMVKQFIDE